MPNVCKAFEVIDRPADSQSIDFIFEDGKLFPLGIGVAAKDMDLVIELNQGLGEVIRIELDPGILFRGQAMADLKDFHRDHVNLTTG